MPISIDNGSQEVIDDFDIGIYYVPSDVHTSAFFQLILTDSSMPHYTTTSATNLALEATTSLAPGGSIQPSRINTPTKLSRCEQAALMGLCCHNIEAEIARRLVKLHLRKPDNPI